MEKGTEKKEIEQKKVQHSIMEKETIEQEKIIEAVLFTMGKSVEARQLSVALGCSVDQAKKVARSLMQRYEKEQSAMKIIELENAFQMCTRPEYYDALIRVAKTPKRQVLTEAVLETLSIIAYKQPVTKTEIAIAAIWKKILGCERIGRNMTFFELGGDSLSAIRFINMYTDSKISLQMLTAYPLLKDLAAAVDMTEGAEEENEEVWEEEEEII